MHERDLLPERTFGIGNAKNDHAYLKLCGCVVAVGNALLALKEMAHILTAAARGAGVAEIIDRLIATELSEVVDGRECFT